MAHHRGRCARGRGGVGVGAMNKPNLTGLAMELFGILLMSIGVGLLFVCLLAIFQ